MPHILSIIQKTQTCQEKIAKFTSEKNSPAGSFFGDFFGTGFFIAGKGLYMGILCNMPNIHRSKHLKYIILTAKKSRNSLYARPDTDSIGVRIGYGTMLPRDIPSCDGEWGQSRGTAGHL